MLCLTRLAEDKSLKMFVQKWRSEHSDWKVLANFMLSKNTSRHFKRSVTKRKITKDGLLVEKELLHKRLESRVGHGDVAVSRGRPQVCVNQVIVSHSELVSKQGVAGAGYRRTATLFGRWLTRGWISCA